MWTPRALEQSPVFLQNAVLLALFHLGPRWTSGV